MKTDKGIRAVEMTREIRDRFYEVTRNLSEDELLRFIQDRSQAVRERRRESVGKVTS